VRSNLDPRIFPSWETGMETARPPSRLSVLQFEILPAKLQHHRVADVTAQFGSKGIFPSWGLGWERHTTLGFFALQSPNSISKIPTPLRRRYQFLLRSSRGCPCSGRLERLPDLLPVIPFSFTDKFPTSNLFNQCLLKKE